MEPKRKAKGSWGVRFFIFVLAISLGILSFWVLTFVESDIGNIKKPDRTHIRAEYIDPELDNQKGLTQKDITHLNREITKLNEQAKNLNNSTRSLQNTINQLLSIQKQSIEKDTEFPQKSLKSLSDSQSTFLDNQSRIQQLNKQISETTLQRQAKQDELTRLTDRIRPLEVDFEVEWQSVMRKHNWKVAALKLAFLLPVFLVASFLFMKYRTGAYWSMVWAIFIASFVKIAFVAHKYFPSPYFKYIAITVIIAIVLRILVYLIRMIVAPKKDLLIKQYQQLYDKCLCPVCTKPIRTGPLRFIGGLRKKMPVQVASSDDLTKSHAYTCPSCGSGLYHKCEKCDNVRHSLLPYCEHCGDEKSDSGAENA